MHFTNYTPDNVARALGLGGFAKDMQLAQAGQAIRLLLLPAFHVELCLTLTKTADAHTLSVVAAREQIWQQVWPSPRQTQIHAADNLVSREAFEDLAVSLKHAALAPSQGRVILDGMSAHAVLRTHRELETQMNENVAQRSAYSTFVAAALHLAWYSVTDPQVRNAVRAAGSYVNLELPEEPVPHQKPTIRTVVLGPDDVASQILDGLKKQHKS
jgi:hypothetical protein